jgi:hypothetical protein
VSILTAYDPNSVFSNPFLDTLMGLSTLSG